MSESQPQQQPAPQRSRIQRLLGIRRREGRYLKFGLTKWGWALVILVLGGVGMASFAEYSMQPDFCRSCHIMEPYYQAWHNSTHRGVSCVECHFEPGLEKTLYGKWQATSQAIKYITDTYGSKPHAEVRDASCMRSGCHEKRVLEGKADWQVPTKRGGRVTIRFDHAPHLQEERRGKHLRCVSCHSQIVQGQHLTVTLDTCFLCHFKGKEHGRNEQALGGCKGCHEAPKGQIVLATGNFNHAEYVDEKKVECTNCHSDTIKGDGAVPRQVCWNCHNLPHQVARYSETHFMHEAHVSEHKVECSACHVQIEHNIDAGAVNLASKRSMAHGAAEVAACGQCHEQTHAGPAELYRGEGGRGVPDMPSPMFRAQVDCMACHKQRKNASDAAEIVGQVYLAVQDSCDACHGNKYDGRLAEWKATVNDHLNRAEIAFNDAKTAVDGAKLTGMDGLSAKRLLDDASHNIRLVKLGHGVHNVNYATALLNVAIESSTKAAKLVPAAPAPAPGRSP